MLHEVVIPILDQTTTEATLVRWLKQEGELVRQGEVVCEIETDKATVEVESKADGTLRRHLVLEGTSIPPLTVIALIGDPSEPLPEVDAFHRVREESPATPAPSIAAPPESEPVTPSSERILISPRARRIAEEHGIDVSTLRGSGPNGRIIEDDVMETVQRGAAAPAGGRAARAKAERVERAWQTIPHFYTSITVDMSRVAARKTGAQTYTDYFAQAIAAALRTHPELNGHWTESGLVVSPEVHLGLVVQAERGLVIPVLRNVERRSLDELAAERGRLVEAARAGKLPADAMSGATISLSNMGAGHIDAFTAIINPPEVAILSVGSVQTRPVVVGDQLQIRPTAAITLGVDHRAIDGRQSAAFLEALKHHLEAE